jgi:hypothetical protein
MNGKQAKRLRRAMCENRSVTTPLVYESDGANYTRNLRGFDENYRAIFDHDLHNVGTLRRNDKYRQLKRHLQTQSKGAK